MLTVWEIRYNGPAEFAIPVSLLPRRGWWPLRYAYTSLIYGSDIAYVMGALALGSSLMLSGSEHKRVLLHTEDVHADSLQLLGQIWQLQQVPYIISAGDLHVSSDKARFREVFTKFACH